ncbi:MAG TPA: hypothetical protein ENK05_00655 [Gammaproteobacteria bacterium]|nr:hypothetical protein [Gammaproteobacteria bacterium]
MQMPQHLPAPAANPSSTPSLLSVAVPVQQAGWDEALGERVQWMLGQRISGAQVRLNPANLGPMEIRIQVQNDQATVHFVSGHAMVREALDAALPRLRDMLEASGVQLVDVDISGESSAGGQGRAAAGEAPFAALPGATEYATPDAVLETAVTTLMERGRLDLFA